MIVILDRWIKMVGYGWLFFDVLLIIFVFEMIDSEFEVYVIGKNV